MPRFGSKSLGQLKSANTKLQVLFEEVVKEFDCSVLDGHRTEEEQNEAFRKGHSKLQFPQSKHNKYPSMAVDVAPYPIDWNDKERFYYFAGYVKGVAESLDIKIRWGGDWDGDTHVKDQTFFDLPHFELVEE